MKKAKTYGLTHIAIAVTDLNQTLEFYQKIFDVEVMYHKDDFLQVTTPGAKDIIVFEKKKADPGNYRAAKTGGLAHFGFRLRKAKDIDEMANRVKSAGGTIIDQGEFVPGEPYIFFKDPDGYNVEIWYELIEE
jgi:catechol 2,3-dioxygenase-like lactoylglutathione lyase family enzyme